MTISQGPVTATNDFFTDVATGKYPDTQVINIYGYNADITATVVPTTTWPSNTVKSHFTSAKKIEVVSDSNDDKDGNSGARTMEVRGLDNNFEEISETFTLDGTSAVVSNQSFRRVNFARVATAGASDANVGFISIRGITASGDQAYILEGANQTLQADYTVPAGKVALLYDLSLSVHRRQNTAADGFLLVRPFQGLYQITSIISADSTGTSYARQTYSAPIVIDEKSDIDFRAVVDTGNATVGGSFSFVVANKE